MNYYTDWQLAGRLWYDQNYFSLYSTHMEMPKETSFPEIKKEASTLCNANLIWQHHGDPLKCETFRKHYSRWTGRPTRSYRLAIAPVWPYCMWLLDVGKCKAKRLVKEPRHLNKLQEFREKFFKNSDSITELRQPVYGTGPHRYELCCEHRGAHFGTICILSK
jgi:hypothetical protein